jgi:hypothetical protein
MTRGTKQPYAQYARQSRIRVRSALQAAAACSIISAVVAVMGRRPRIPLEIEAFFLLVSALELLNARRNERCATSGAEAASKENHDTP